MFVLTKPAGTPSNLVAFPPAHCHSLREKRILKFLPLVESRASYLLKRLPASFDVDDLRGPGFVGLVEGVDSFRARRGCKLEVHVRTCIDRAIRDSYRRRNWTAATHEPAEAADHLTTPSNLEQVIDEAKAAEQLAGAVKNLDTREQQVIHLIYVRGETVRDIGDRMGLHNSNVTRIHRGAIGRLRRHYALRGVTAA